MKMTSAPDRQHDAFANPAKFACRAGNLRVLREAAYRRRRRSGRIKAQWRPDP